MSLMRFIRDVRLLPIALIASACLLALKVADIALDGSRWLASENAPAATDGTTLIRTSPDALQNEKLSWAQQMFNFPGRSGANPAGELPPAPADRINAEQAILTTANPDITGAITPPAAGRGAKPPPPGTATKPGSPAVTPPDGIVIPTNGPVLPSGAEREILERLAQRREQLDTRARELDIRENLVKAAEQRIDAHLAEIKEVEARIKSETQEKDQVEAARFKGLVTMYENMKPRDAAKIFDGLDMDVLIKVVAEINPRTMADIMAQMSPELAERLTVALASKSQPTAKNDPAQLPKIQGQPIAP
ncbi:MAG: flagellar protein FlbB [Xanthobacteraceae bacterium]